MTLLPRSLLGQIALVMAGALLVAQMINFGLIFTERQRGSRAQIEAPAVDRFVGMAQRIATLPPERTEQMLARRAPRLRLEIAGASPVAVGDEALARRLRESAAGIGLAIRDARGARSDTVELAPRLRPFLGPQGSEAIERRGRRLQTLILSVQLADGRWINGRLVTPRPTRWLALRPLAATLLTYLIILAAMIWTVARLARPLRDLAYAAERFQGRGKAPHVRPSGPADVARAIEAFNAMGERVDAMLAEKDRMLGAIGHDLRTPLASLRIRAEGIEPVEERIRMIATIEEMAAMLDDALALARSGRGVEAVRRVDIAALADSLVEEYRSTGRDVTMKESGKVTAAVDPGLVRRAIRNLVDNGLKYGGGARVVVREEGSEVLIEVSDSGPGIAESEFANVQEPFYRVEPSRSRETGGAGLGLALARAAAEAHGGGLVLRNLEVGGLCATLRLPLGNQAA